MNICVVHIVIVIRQLDKIYVKLRVCTYVSLDQSWKVHALHLVFFTYHLFPCPSSPATLSCSPFHLMMDLE